MRYLFFDDLTPLFNLDEQLDILEEMTEPKFWVLQGDDCKGWKNVSDSGKYKWRGGTWKKYWEKYSHKKWPLQCRMKGCTDCAEDGAHIFQKNGKQYIIPMCAHFNRGRSDEFFDLNVGTVAVEIDLNQVYRVK